MHSGALSNVRIVFLVFGCSTGNCFQETQLCLTLDLNIEEAAFVELWVMLTHSSREQEDAERVWRACSRFDAV